MCEYLYAAFSLKTAPDDTLPAEHLAAVERWRTVVLGVAAQEMLHWALVNNLLTAVGSAPYVARPHMPHQAKGYPAGVQLALVPFGERALRHFLYLERPEGMELDDADGFEATGPALPIMAPTDIVPWGQEFGTVGHLYRSIQAGLHSLAARLGEDGLFIGPREAQMAPESFRWSLLVPITDVAVRQQGDRRHRRTGRGRSRRLDQRPLRPLPRRARRVPGDQGRLPRLRAGAPGGGRRGAAGRRGGAGGDDHRPGDRGRVRPLQRQLRPHPAAARALLRPRWRGPRASRAARPHRRDADVRRDQTARAAARHLAGRPRPPRRHRRRRLPALLPEELPAPAPAGGVDPLPGAPRRGGRVRRRHRRPRAGAHRARPGRRASCTSWPTPSPRGSTTDGAAHPRVGVVVGRPAWRWTIVCSSGRPTCSPSPRSCSSSPRPTASCSRHRPVPQWPPADMADWPQTTRDVAAAWTAWARDRDGAAPELVRTAWAVVRDGVDTPIEDIAEGRAWPLCEALLVLHTVADEACAGMGVAVDDPRETALRRARPRPASSSLVPGRWRGSDDPACGCCPRCAPPPAGSRCDRCRATPAFAAPVSTRCGTRSRPNARTTIRVAGRPTSCCCRGRCGSATATSGRGRLDPTRGS